MSDADCGCFRLTEGVNEAYLHALALLFAREKARGNFGATKAQGSGAIPQRGDTRHAPCWHGSCACPLRDVPICRETHGKPVLKGCTNLFFNISHSGDYAVCAVSKQPVGIDIERIGAYQPNVARRVCSDAEQKLLEQCEDPALPVLQAVDAQGKLCEINGDRH